MLPQSARQGPRSRRPHHLHPPARKQQPALPLPRQHRPPDLRHRLRRGRQGAATKRHPIRGGARLHGSDGHESDQRQHHGRQRQHLRVRELHPVLHRHTGYHTRSE